MFNSIKKVLQVQQVLQIKLGKYEQMELNKIHLYKLNQVQFFQRSKSSKDTTILKGEVGTTG